MGSIPRHQAFRVMAALAFAVLGIWGLKGAATSVDGIPLTVVTVLLSVQCFLAAGQILPIRTIPVATAAKVFVRLAAVQAAIVGVLVAGHSVAFVWRLFVEADFASMDVWDKVIEFAPALLALPFLGVSAFLLFAAWKSWRLAADWVGGLIVVFSALFLGSLATIPLIIVRYAERYPASENLAFDLLLLLVFPLAVLLLRTAYGWFHTHLPADPPLAPPARGISREIVLAFAALLFMLLQHLGPMVVGALAPSASTGVIRPESWEMVAWGGALALAWVVYRLGLKYLETAPEPLERRGEA